MAITYRILVASEDAETLNTLREYLQSQDFELRSAASFPETLQILDAWPADLVICEDHIGRIHGLDLLGEVRKRNRRTRFLILTPPGETPDFMRPSGDRTVAFLGRPFQAPAFIQHVRGSLGLDESFANRRAHCRYSFNMETHCILINPFDDSEGRPVAALMRDVSRSGLSMILRQVLPVPSMLKLVIELANQHNPLQILSKSISCTLTQIPGVYRLGIKFIGLLPQELEELMLAHGGARDRNTSTDIFLGKSFKTAVREWVAHHQNDLFAEITNHGRPIEDLAEELAKDSSEPQPPDPILTPISER
jgi:CheY-like chemotaxis protein